MVGNHFSSIILKITDNMKRFFLTFAMLLLVALSWGKGIARPKLVVGIVVDQMRWDYLYYYNEKYGDDGLKRLLSEGFSCENTMITHVPTVTAIGHSSVYTGSVPAFTGIAGNNFFLNGKNVTSVTDTTVHAVGSDISHRAGQCSPRNLIANTIGDQLKIATDFKAKVIGVALKDRAAILPAGHAAEAEHERPEITFDQRQQPLRIFAAVQQAQQLLEQGFHHQALPEKARVQSAGEAGIIQLTNVFWAPISHFEFVNFEF